MNMARERRYYDISSLLKTNAQYMILLGQRANGKSYQVKKYVLEKAFSTDEKFVYLRRWKEDQKEKIATSYFEDMPVDKLTKGVYDEVKAYQGFLYFVKYDEEGKTSSKKLIGRYCGLNEYERYKSQVFKDYTSIIYEEFITDKIYLNDEPRLLQHFVSTVARLDEIKVFLVGNTLTRVCPYFYEWCLEGTLRQEQGTIQMYHYNVDDAVIDIAVEFCANTNNENKMFFGQAAKQIVSGEWDVKDLPKLPRKREEYEKAYDVLVEYQNFRFVIELLVEPKEGGVICFVYPYTKQRKMFRIITSNFSDKPNVSSKLDITRRPEKLITDCLKLDKVCFSDNLTGSDFKRVLEEMKIY